MNRFTFVFKLVFKIINFLVETSKKKLEIMCFVFTTKRAFFDTQNCTELFIKFVILMIHKKL